VYTPDQAQDAIAGAKQVLSHVRARLPLEAEQ